jgi:ribose/xylose/arabinose/galactoside ABC-type transport system permease subunit
MTLNFSEQAIAALGMALLILVRKLDLSVAATIALAGFITEAYLHGALDEQVMHHARQKTITTTRGYRQRAKVVLASPTKLLDL